MSGSRFTPGAAVTERTRRLRKIWRAMTPDERVLAIRAAGQERGTGFVTVLRSHVAQTLKIRPVTVQSWSLPQLAEATLRAPLGEDLLSDLLIGLHLTERVPLLSGFLDAAGVPHTGGVTDPDVEVELDEARILEAADAVLTAFPEHDCRIYFATLLAMEGDTWAPLESRLDESLRA
jgi:hypothetical protein